MPRAVSPAEDTRKVALKSCPPDGYVVLRRLSYGETLQRREMASSFGADISKDKGLPSEISARMNLVESQVFDFSRCIVEHNLEDDKGKKLDLSSRHDILRLDVQVANEIEDAISLLNDIPEELDDPKQK